MATFRLVASGDLDTTQSEFAFVVSGGHTYLKFGLLDVDNRQHFESVISGGRVGFFASGSDLSDSEAPNARILADYDAENGVEVDRVPSALEVGSDYEIKWTQARPGKDVTTVIQGRIWFFPDYETDIGVRTTVPFGYTIIEETYAGFEAVFFPNITAFNEKRPLTVDDLSYPEEVRFDPNVPETAPGDYVGYLSFIPRTEGELVLDILFSGDPTYIPEIYLIDADGDLLIDANGDLLVQAV